MTLDEVLKTIDSTPVHFTIVPDGALEAWARYATGVFNEPAPGTQEQVVEIVGRKLAADLRSRLNGALPPAPARLLETFKRLYPNETDEMYKQLGMWCEVVCVYLGDA